MEANCPYCQGNVTHIYEAVEGIHSRRGKPDDIASALCPNCGEPMAFDHGVFRKATDEELEKLVDDEDYHRSRAIWMEIEARRHMEIGPPVEHMWRLYVKEAELLFSNKDSEMKARAIFFSGVAMATAYFKEAMSQEEHVFHGRMNLLETELEVAAGVDTFEQIGDVMRRILDDLAGNAKRKRH